MKLVLQMYVASINDKIALTTSKMGATLNSKLGVRLSASSFNFKTRESAGGSTSPIEGQQFYLWVSKEQTSDSVLKSLQKKFKDGAVVEMTVNPDTYEVIEFSEPMTQAEFKKSNLELTERVGLAV